MNIPALSTGNLNKNNKESFSVKTSLTFINVCFLSLSVNELNSAFNLRVCLRQRDRYQKCRKFDDEVMMMVLL